MHRLFGSRQLADLITPRKFEHFSPNEHRLFTPACVSKQIEMCNLSDSKLPVPGLFEPEVGGGSNREIVSLRSCELAAWLPRESRSQKCIWRPFPLPFRLLGFRFPLGHQSFSLVSLAISNYDYSALFASGLILRNYICGQFRIGWKAFGAQHGAMRSAAPLYIIYFSRALPICTSAYFRVNLSAFELALTVFSLDDMMHASHSRVKKGS